MVLRRNAFVGAGADRLGGWLKIGVGGAEPTRHRWRRNLLGRSTTDELTIMLRSITFAASLVGVASDCTSSGQTEPT